MEVRNCRNCGKLFNYVRGPRLCQRCVKELEEKFQQVKQYIKKNPHDDMGVIAKENEVSINQIKQWVREERLSFGEDSPIALECENCGARILTGRFCKDCKDKMQNNLNNAIDKPKPVVEKKKSKDKDRMRFLDKM